jgi:hypothetical protein
LDHIAHEQELHEAQVRERSGSRAPLYFVLAGLLILLLWAGLKGWRLYQVAQSLLTYQAAAESLRDTGPAQMDPDEVEALVNGLRTDVLILKREVSPFMPIISRLGWLPRYGPTLAAAPHLLEMADAGTAAAGYAMRGLEPALAAMQGENASGSPLPELVRAIDNAEADLVQSSREMERVIAARNEIVDVDALNWRIIALFDQFDSRLPLASGALKLAPALPTIMGMDGPRTYLLIAQNQDELRPTGGYISGVGVLTVDNGEIVDLEFVDANLVGAWWEKPFDFPPQPLYELMGLELFLFRDANFWPDHPTSAEQAIALAGYSLDLPPLDGAISIDQQFVADLLAVTGPVQIPELGVVVSQDNVINELRAAWGLGEGEDRLEWLHNRKDFLGPFAASLRTRLEMNFASIDPVYLADTLFESIAQKHIQIYTRDPEAAAILDELAWDGRLDNPAGQDFLMVVDTNVGYNKVNPLIDSNVEYSISLDDMGGGVAELNLEYIHGGEQTGEPCTQGRDEVYAGGRYEELVEGCYWNYLRVYAPAGSELLDAGRHSAPESAFYNMSGWDQPAETIFEHPLFTTFSNFFLLPEGETLTTYFSYRLPQEIIKSSGDLSVYRLKVASQAGVPARSLTVQLALPANAVFVSAAPQPVSMTENSVTFSANLDRDLEFSVTYR